MKTKVAWVALGILLFASCSKDSEMAPPPQGFEEKDVAAIKDNVAKIFGVTFDPNHDWNSTVSGNITINVTPLVKKVQVLALVKETNDEGDEVTSMTVLNEADVNSQSTVKLYYDAPKSNEGLYVAFISGDNYSVQKIEGSTVSYQRAKRRAIDTNYTLPTGELKLDMSLVEPSFAAQRGWLPEEKLYQMSDYVSQKMAVADYDDEYKTVLRNVIFSYFKNGRKYNNLPLVKNSGMYNEKAYPITTADEPIIISPVYKNDGGWKEIIDSDLYYYYFKDEDLVGKDPVAYLESLPKYKAIQFNQCIVGDDEIKKHAAYALVYWGEGVPTAETVGSYLFPDKYRIGFMVRAKSTQESGKKQGELYGDGRLNNYINFYDKCNFKTSNLGQDGPRMGWMTVNGRMLLCCESGTDADFNDIILEIEGGVEDIVVYPELEENVYTYCFEDRDLGDYDLNDVVIKTSREGNKVTYSIVACGAWDELYVMNVNCGAITDNAEVHSLFGVSQNTFVNTVMSDEKRAPITATKTVSADFSFLNEANQPYIYNKTTGKIIKVAKVGQDPHAIMIPNDFLYMIEKKCIKDGYEQFNSWGQNPVNSNNWYNNPNYVNVYTK